MQNATQRSYFKLLWAPYFRLLSGSYHFAGWNLALSMKSKLSTRFVFILFIFINVKYLEDKIRLCHSTDKLMSIIKYK